MNAGIFIIIFWIDEIMYNIKVIRSNRRTIGLEIKNDLRIIVRAPFYMNDSDIRRFVLEKSSWIEKHLEKIRSLNAEAAPPLTNEEIRVLADAAMKDIPLRVKNYANKMSLSVGRITIRNQKTRWGSCSSKGNLNFNCLLMLCPDRIRDYVVVHELCHMYEMNHSPAFWSHVERIMPDYQECRNWLKENGSRIIGRIGQ